MKTFVATAVLFLSVPYARLFADPLANCDGVITNRPCGASITPQPIAPSFEAQVRSKKSQLLHNLTMKNLKAKQELAADVDISEARQMCNDPSTSVEGCRSAVAHLEELINDQVHARVLAHSENRRANPAPVNRAPQTVIINNGWSNPRVPNYDNQGRLYDRRYGDVRRHGHGDAHGSDFYHKEHRRPFDESRHTYPGKEMSRPAIPPGSTAKLPPVPKPQRMRHN